MLYIHSYALISGDLKTHVFLPGKKIKVELAHHLIRGAVLNAVQTDVVVPHGGALYLLKGEVQQVLVDAQKPMGHHLHGEILF